MKTKIIIIAAIVIVNLAWTSPSPTPLSISNKKIENVKAKQNQTFAFFRTHRQGRGITATWGLISNIGITDLVLERLYGDANDPYNDSWEVVCSMSCNNARSYKATDNNVLAGTINYRVVAMDGLTPVDMSDISTERIVQH